jgi:hypothetical protein
MTRPICQSAWSVVPTAASLGLFASLLHSTQTPQGAYTPPTEGVYIGAGIIWL